MASSKRSNNNQLNHRRSQSNSNITQHYQRERRQAGYNGNRYGNGRNRGGSLSSCLQNEQQYENFRPYRPNSRTSFTMTDPVVVDLAQSSDDETREQQPSNNNKENASSLRLDTGERVIVRREMCNKMKNCGRHRCQEVCHPGQCGECLNIRWQELTCQCGLTILYPPIPCGAKPPPCHRKCSRGYHSNRAS